MPLGARSLRYLLFASVALLSVSCDQGTKIWARSALAGRGSVPVIDGFWDFHLAQNTGAAFSLLRDSSFGRALLSAVGVFLLGMILWWLKTVIDKGWLPVAALALIFGGAVGNLWDRIVYGSVTDFVYWHGRTFSWPVFNVADAVLLVGAVLMFFSGATRRRESTSQP